MNNLKKILGQILCIVGLHDWETVDYAYKFYINFAYFKNINYYPTQDCKNLKKRCCLKCNKIDNQIKDYHEYCQSIIDGKIKRKEKALEIFKELEN